jgi:hypothetical protein
VNISLKKIGYKKIRYKKIGKQGAATTILDHSPLCKNHGACFERG